VQALGVVPGLDPLEDQNGPPLADHGAETVRNSTAATITSLPPALLQSINWDLTTEMARHLTITKSLGAPVRFCDSQNRCQLWLERDREFLATCD